MLDILDKELKKLTKIISLYLEISMDRLIIFICLFGKKIFKFFIFQRWSWNVRTRSFCVFKGKFTCKYE